MFGSIKYNLTHLFDFRGRDARQTFWYYVLFLAILQFVAGLAISAPLMANMFSQILDAARSGVTDQQALNGMMAQQMGEWSQTLVPYTVTLSGIMIVLFVAAFVRRLLDSDNSGWWAVLPVVTQVVSIWASLSVMGKVRAAMDAMMQNPQTFDVAEYQHSMLGSGLSMIGWIGYIVVIVFGIMKSTDGPNRYGEAPVRF